MCTYGIDRIPTAKDWKRYSGTVYYGCPDEFTLGKSALDTIRPKVFDTTTGELVSPAIPTAPAGVDVTGGVCTLSGTAEATKVPYAITPLRQAQGSQPEVSQAIASVFDLKSSQPLITKELNQRVLRPPRHETATDRCAFQL